MLINGHLLVSKLLEFTVLTFWTKPVQQHQDVIVLTNEC